MTTDQTDTGADLPAKLDEIGWIFQVEGGWSKIILPWPVGKERATKKELLRHWGYLEDSLLELNGSNFQLLVYEVADEHARTLVRRSREGAFRGPGRPAFLVAMDTCIRVRWFAADGFPSLIDLLSRLRPLQDQFD